jgi:predicted AAA+ superfamily ATPase
MYVRRDIESELSAYFKSDSKQILLLSGARQTGKSTLVEYAASNLKKTIINLWDEENETIALRNARTFSEFENILKTVFNFTPHTGCILIIDEAQASEHISSFIMEMQRKWTGQKVVLLGSLLANLYKKGAPMPVGRTIEIICRPLNFKEFLRFRKKEHYLELLENPDRFSTDIHNLLLDEYRYYLQIGGLPGIVAAGNARQDMTLLFESLLGNMYRDADRYIDPEDGSRHHRVAQYGRVLETVMKSIAHHLGSSTQNATLLSSDSPAYRTVLPHVLEALSAWHLTYTLTFQTAQYSTKKGYSSKKYLFDTGIANFLLTRLMPVQFQAAQPAAAMLLENGVLQDCVSQVESIQAIQCYRSSNKTPTELDFVVTRKGHILPIEVKSASTVKNQTISQLIDFMRHVEVSQGYVVYTGLPKTEVIGGKTIRFIPPYMLCCELQNYSK